MTDAQLVLLVGGMALVTYLPRLLPFLITPKRKYPAKVQQFLSYLPFAILGALIFPGVLSSTGDTASAVVGMMVALILAWRRAHLIVVVVGAILAAAAVSTLMG